MESEKEKKYRRISWISTALVQVLLLLLFYFLIAWKEPFPPIPSYGVELSLGLEDAGSGEMPVATPVPEEPVEETVEPEVTETEVIEEVTEPTEVVEEAPVVNTESPHVVEEKPKETPPKEQPKETPKEQPKKEEPRKPTEEKKPVQEALMPTADTNTSKGQTSEEGNEGRKEGSLDGRALMGDQGNSNISGSSLQMSGWVWDFKPQPKDESTESGKIVYRITVDEDGYLVKIDLVSSTVSAAVERQYRQSVERLSFSKNNDYQPAPMSTGTVTFIIRSK